MTARPTNRSKSGLIIIPPLLKLEIRVYIGELLKVILLWPACSW
jgi:hypothetical protein